MKKPSKGVKNSLSRGVNIRKERRKRELERAPKPGETQI